MAHPENSTGASPNQHPIKPSACLLGDFTPAQRQVVAGLLLAERSHASKWWTFLSELRLNGQLPEWAKTQEVGRHADYDRWELDCQATNRELLGFSGHLHAYGADATFVVLRDLGDEA
ncbi:hypothetical protein [Pseudomonas putida]|uniref:hypothetical protein n=1 Tax=Pseudomonas putida TaxID=303 RepID=UPI0013CE8B66|nr:hypothetical protein [Pseudomonas putida]